MCIMEVRDGQRTSTIAQAMAHNTSTIERDLDMFRKMVEARKEGQDILDQLKIAQELLFEAYERFLHLFGETVAKEVENGHNPDNHTHGSERTFVAQAHHDAELARRFETR